MYVSKLKQYQTEEAIPTEDLSRILNVSKQMIYYWREFGIRNWTTASRVAKVLKCEVDDIIGMTHNENIK